MVSTAFCFCLTALLLYNMALVTSWTTIPPSPSVHQERDFLLPHIGENITLKCFYEIHGVRTIYWYKQTLGQKPLPITAYVTHDKKVTYNEYEGNPRFTLDVGNNKNHLFISNVRVSDSASYFCAKQKWSALQFDEGITVTVRASESNIQVLDHQSENVQPRGSVTQSCTFETGGCDGEYRVYWFKNVGEPHPGLFYVHESSSDQCERNENTRTQTCVYSLSMESFNLSHPGTYFCAVALCGHVVFGNGIKLYHDEGVMVYFWSAASAVSALLSVSLALSICIMNKRSNSTSSALSPSTEVNAKSHLNETILYCIALLEMKRPEREMDRTWTECVYCSVTQ